MLPEDGVRLRPCAGHPDVIRFAFEQLKRHRGMQAGLQLRRTQLERRRRLTHDVFEFLNGREQVYVRGWRGLRWTRPWLNVIGGAGCSGQAAGCDSS